MANDGYVHPAIELLPDLLEALDWCGRRIAQALQDDAVEPLLVCGEPRSGTAAVQE
jgi:hypothetical protein